jgi:hypothetical protein
MTPLTLSAPGGSRWIALVACVGAAVAMPGLARASEGYPTRYRVTTSQGLGGSVAVVRGRVNPSIPVKLRCSDGSSILVRIVRPRGGLRLTATRTFSGAALVGSTSIRPRISGRLGRTQASGRITGFADKNRHELRCQVEAVTFANASTPSPGPPSSPSPPPPVSDQKAIWGPTTVNGQSEFPVYRDLGVGIYEMGLNWAGVAPTSPRNAADPNDPSYHWPADVDYAIQQATSFHMRVLLLVQQTPSWANNGAGWNYPPTNPTAFGDFVTAASRRYPSVHLWMIWGEPSRSPNWALDSALGSQTIAPRAYAEILDASYGALKAVSSANLVIGGDTYTTGDVSTQQWIENLRLPDGLPPRMDLYGHNPFSWRDPNLLNPPSPDGQVDFSDLGRLSTLVNSNLAAPGQTIRLFLSEWAIPTAPGDDEFSFYVSPSAQAQWITDAWHIVRHSSFIYALGWIHVYDDPPGGSNAGLLYANGTPKPGYDAFKYG